MFTSRLSTSAERTKLSHEVANNEIWFYTRSPSPRTGVSDVEILFYIAQIMAQRSQYYPLSTSGPFLKAVIHEFNYFEPPVKL